MQKNFIYAGFITLVALLIPAVLQLTIGTGVDGQGFNWKLSDFVIMGVIIYVFSLGVTSVWRSGGKGKVLWIVAMLVAFLWLWAELAVGVFTQWGS